MSYAARSMLAFTLLAPTLTAQRSLGEQPIDVGVSGGAVRGVDAGKGWELGATGRWSRKNLRWLAVRTEIAVMSLKNAAFSTDIRDLLPGSNAQFSDYRVNASSVALSVGPEIRAQIGRVAPYAHVAIGGMNATSNGEFLGTRTPARDTFPATVLRPAAYSPLADRRATIAIATVSSGVRLALGRGMQLDLEARRTHTGRIPWKREGLVTNNGSALASVLYRRRLDVWSVHVGGSYAP